MYRILLKTIVHNAPRKLISCIIGYHVWLMISSWLPTYRWLEIPLCFYGVSEALRITAPESMRVALYGSRSDLYHLDTNALAVHIDTRNLPQGLHSVTLTHNHLLLPQTIHLAQWSPSNMKIEIHRAENQ
jgi:hypothetical protein